MPDEITSDAQAAEALFSAVAEDTGREGHTDPGHGHRLPEAPVESKPEDATPDAPTEETQEAATSIEDSFTKLDPSAIPDELKPWYQSMQADYVRKTQAVAEARKQYEALGTANPVELQQAYELFTNLQNPQFALNFHEQVGQTLTQMGLLEQAQAVQAAQQREGATQPPPTFSHEDDPEAYFQGKVHELEQNFQNMQNQLTQDREAAQKAQFEAALAGEISRQEQYIRDTNQHYTDGDINAIYQMSAWFNGDLMSAQGAYENAVADRVNRLLATKATAQDVSPVPTGPPTLADTPHSFGDNLDAAHAAAQEALKNWMAQN